MLKKPSEENSLKNHVQEEKTQIYKSQLFEKFQERGILQDLKAKMRYDILNKLKSNKENQDINEIYIPSEITPNVFQSRLINNLISDYLKVNNMNYTYSIFLNETKLLNNMLSPDEMFEYFAQKSALFKSRKNNIHSDHLSIIEILLEILYDKTLLIEKVNGFCQTESDNTKTIESHIKDIDENYIYKLGYYKLNSMNNAQEQLEKYKKDLESRYQADLKYEISKVKEYELANMRYEESQKFQKKMDDFKRQMEKSNYEKLRKIKEREEDAIKLCKAKINDIEKKEYENRQDVLKEMEKIKKRETELMKHNCMENQEFIDQKNKIKNMEEELTRKMREYDLAKDALQEKLLKDIVQRKVSLIAENDKKSNLALQKELEREREFIKHHSESLQNLEIQRSYLSKENDFLTSENKELEVLRQNQQESINSLRMSVMNLKNQVDNQYQMIANKDNEIEKLKIEMREQERIINDLKQIVEKLKNEQMDSLGIYQRDIEKYKALLKRKENDLKKEIKKDFKETLKGNLMEADEKFFEKELKMDVVKKKQYEKNVNEIFNHMNNLRKDRLDYLEDDINFDEDEEKPDKTVNIQEKNNDLILLNNAFNENRINFDKKSNDLSFFETVTQKPVLNEISKVHIISKPSIKSIEPKTIEKPFIKHEKTSSIDKEIEEINKIKQEKNYFSKEKAIPKSEEHVNTSNKIQNPSFFDVSKERKDISSENVLDPFPKISINKEKIVKSPIKEEKKETSQTITKKSNLEPINSSLEKNKFIEKPQEDIKFDLHKPKPSNFLKEEDNPKQKSSSFHDKNIEDNNDTLKAINFFEKTKPMSAQNIPNIEKKILTETKSKPIEMKKEDQKNEFSLLTGETSTNEPKFHSTKHLEPKKEDKKNEFSALLGEKSIPEGNSSINTQNVLKLSKPGGISLAPIEKVLTLDKFDKNKESLNKNTKEFVGKKDNDSLFKLDKKEVHDSANKFETTNTAKNFFGDLGFEEEFKKQDKKPIGNTINLDKNKEKVIEKNETGSISINLGMKSNVNQPTEIKTEKKKSPNPPKKQDKFEMDEFDDLLGELEFMSDTKPKKIEKPIEKNIIINKDKDKTETKNTLPALGLKENKEIKKQEPIKLDEKNKELEKKEKFDINQNKKKEKENEEEEIGEEIIEEIDFGEIDEADLFD